MSIPTSRVLGGAENTRDAYEKQENYLHIEMHSVQLVNTVLHNRPVDPFYTGLNLNVVELYQSP